jgi:hypothetical protein
LGRCRLARPGSAGSWVTPLPRPPSGAENTARRTCDSPSEALVKVPKAMFERSAAATEARPRATLRRRVSGGGSFALPESVGPQRVMYYAIRLSLNRRVTAATVLPVCRPCDFSTNPKPIIGPGRFPTREKCVKPLAQIVGIFTLHYTASTLIRAPGEALREPGRWPAALCIPFPRRGCYAESAQTAVQRPTWPVPGERHCR